MKKKTRQINIEGTKYIWSVVEQDWPQAVLNVWIDGQKNKPWCSAIFSLDEIQAITPKIVAKAIKGVLEDKGHQPENVTKTIELNLE